MLIGVLSTVFPTRRNPTAGIFVKEELEALSGFVDVRLLAPLPNQHWISALGSTPVHTLYPVFRPFTLAFPRFFLQHCYPASLAFTLRLRGSRFFRGCDVIHAHNAFPEGVAAVRAFGHDRPVVVTVHGSDINHFAMKPSLKPDIVTALNASAHIICVSGSLAVTLRSIGVTTETTVIPNGINTTMLHPGDKAEATHLLGLDPSRKRILFAGNFVPVKGVEYLIKAMPTVLAEYPGCELVLLGASSVTAGRQVYAGAISEEGIGKTVRIVERVPHDHLPSWIHASDLLALPSLNEGFGLVAAEALACGRPVVATLSGGPEDIVEEGTGVLVPPRDPEALARGMVRVLNGEGIDGPEELAMSARRRFSYERVAERITEVYTAVLS